LISGYTEGMIDCIRSLSKWEKLMVNKTEYTVSRMTTRVSLVGIEPGDWEGEEDDMEN
jgi:hypothetical protein